MNLSSAVKYGKSSAVATVGGGVKEKLVVITEA